MLCREFEASALVLDIEDMKRLFKKYSPILGKCFEENYAMPNKSCEGIEQILVTCSDPSQWKTKALLEQSTTLDEDMVEKKFQEKAGNWLEKKVNKLWECFQVAPKKNIVQVEVKMIRTDWLFMK